MKDVHKWSTSKKVILIIDCLLCLTVIVSAMLIVIDKSREKNGVVYSGKVKESTSDVVDVDATAAQKGTATARLMCAGDNLIHGSIYRQAKNRSDDGSYDFSYPYAGIKDIISLSDIAFLNQETVMDPEKEPSTYPLFNSPTSLLDEMIDIGFDVYNQATNHVMDKGLSGAKNDIALFKSKKDIILTGLYENQEEMLKPQTKEVNGITFSFVGFTEYLNGLTVPSDSDLGLVYLTDTRSTKEALYQKMKQMIDVAKENSDVVCVSMHWWDENITEPDESQQEIMKTLMEYGADIVIGTGPHALQPIEYMQNGDGEQALCIWSLGNLISCQNATVNLIGGIADVVVKKDFDNNKVSIESAKLIPTITHYGGDYSNVRIIPFSKYSPELASAHGSSKSTFNYDYISNFYNEMFGDKLEIELDK